MATIKLRLSRFDPEEDAAPRHEVYEVESEGFLNVMQAIHRVYDTVDGTLSFRNANCRRGVCGLCSMTINGKRRLACTCLAEDNMTVDPPTNRKVVKDLLYEMD
jgi:succinate dehydrogenase/fumarate reductase iron-sulfur protein